MGRPHLRLPSFDLTWLFPSRGETYPGVDLMELTPDERTRVRKARRPLRLPLWLFDLLRWPSLRLPSVDVQRQPAKSPSRSPRLPHPPRLPRPHMPVALIAGLAAIRARLRRPAWLHRPAWLRRRPLPAWLATRLAWRPSSGQREIGLAMTGLLLIGLAVLTWPKAGPALPSLLPSNEPSPTIIMASPTPTISPTLTPIPSLSPSPTATPTASPLATPTPSLSAPPNVYASRRASLPVCSQKPDCRLYTTKAGDYLRAIAKYYLGPTDADYQRLLRFNPQHSDNPDLIYSGERIFVPDQG